MIYSTSENVLEEVAQGFKCEGFCGLLENNWDLKTALKWILKMPLFFLIMAAVHGFICDQ